MLVLLSDLHLTDATTSVNVRQDAFSEVLKQKIIAQAQKNVKEIHVALLGDIFDLMRTDYWVDKVSPHERPWNGDLDPYTAMNTNPAVKGHFDAVLDRIMATDSAQALLQTLNSLKAATGANPVKVTYVIGNHDKAFHLFQSLKDKIKSQVDQVDGFEFAYSLNAPEYGVLGRHGHEWDVNNHGFEFYNKVLRKGKPVDRFHEVNYRVQTIGEVITAELMSQLVYKLSQWEYENDISRVFGSKVEFKKQFMEVNNIRPLTDVFVWLEWFGRGKLDDRLKSILLKSLKECLRAVLDTGLAKKWDKLAKDLWLFRGDITDRFDQLLRFMGNKKFDDLKKWVEIYNKIIGISIGSSKDDYVKGSNEEWSAGGLSETIQHVVYGHTHEAKHVYFEGKLEGAVRMYVNTGTYLPLIQHAQKGGFTTAHQMTMAFFYRKDEDTNNKKHDTLSMDIWNGIKRKTYI